MVAGKARGIRREDSALPDGEDYPVSEVLRRMKIIKDDKPIAELPDKPKNFDGSCKDGQITLTIGDDEVKIARYSSNDTAGEIVKAMCKAYLAGKDEFILPREEEK